MDVLLLKRAFASAQAAIARDDEASFRVAVRVAQMVLGARLDLVRALDASAENFPDGQHLEMTAQRICEAVSAEGVPMVAESQSR